MMPSIAELSLYPELPRRRDFRIGIIGSGFIVNDCHLVAYRKAGFNPVAIAARSQASARRVADQHQIPRTFGSVDDLLHDKSIEVLDIAVPPPFLLPIIRKACAAKSVRAILAQKPLGMNYTEGCEAVRLCRQAGIILSVNQNMRFDHSVRAAHSLLNCGFLGDPVLATIEMRAIPHWMPWHRDLGWLTLRIMSIHHLDTFRYWFGDPVHIFCSTRPDPRTTFPHSDGICLYILEYANGLRCTAVDDTWAGPAREGCPADLYIRWRIEGLDGVATGDIGWCKNPYTTPSTIRFARRGDLQFAEPRWPESWFPDAFIGTMAQLLLALERGTTPELDATDNLKTMALVDAAYRSAELHRAVSPDEIANSCPSP